MGRRARRWVWRRRGRRGRRRSGRWRAGFALVSGLLVALTGATLSCVVGTDGDRPELWRLPERLERDPIVRVALERGVREIEVAVRGAYTLIDENGRVVDRGEVLAPTRVRADRGSVAFGQYVFRPPWLKLIPARSGTLRVGGRGYRGELVITERPAGRLLVINRVGLEPYIAGVVGNEMPLSWPLAALRAQAIAARTYALERMQARRRAAWDVSDDASSQVYRGLENETERARKVVADTLGVVLVWNDRLLPAFYHSTCGGETIPASWVFGLPDIPPLGGGPCGFCESSRYYRWRVRLGREAVTEALAERGVRPPLENIEVIEWGPARHVDTVRLVHGGGVSKISGKALRRALGPSKLRSTRFDVRLDGDAVVFEGAGWGHAVGMCQVGARGMAEAGYDTRAILSRYYPGARLVSISPPGARSALP